jgi:hypothetical protein
VVSQREEPGAKAGTLRHVALFGVDHTQPGVLEHLVGLGRGVAPQQAAHEAVQRRVMALVQPLERLHIASRKGRHQCHIVGIGLHCWRQCHVVHRWQSAMLLR